MDCYLMNSIKNKQEKVLASGDAYYTDKLVLSPSLTDLLPHPVRDLRREKNADMWIYEVESIGNGSNKFKSQCEGASPTFISMGSLRKSQFKDNSKRQRKITSHKSLKREENTFDRNNKNPKGSHSCITLRENKDVLNFVKMAKLFSCQVCQTSPMTSMSVHMCKHGHITCGNCFNKNNPICEICEEPLEGRNKPIETAIQKLKLICPELFCEKFLTLSNVDNLEEISHTKSTYHSSHKPVKCPHLFCQKTVAYNGFLPHFKFEHFTVPIVTTTPNCSHPFSLSESLLNDTSTKAVTVFKVNLISTKKPRKVLQDGDPVVCCLLTFPLKIGHVKSLGIWCSSLSNSTSSPLIYNLKSPNSRRLITYQGPVASLHESIECILKDGRCLIISPEMLKTFRLQNERPYLFQVEFFFNK